MSIPLVVLFKVFVATKRHILVLGFLDPHSHYGLTPMLVAEVYPEPLLVVDLVLIQWSTIKLIFEGEPGNSTHVALLNLSESLGSANGNIRTLRCEKLGVIAPTSLFVNQIIHKSPFKMN